MFAIIRSGGKQFRITENVKINVPRLDVPVGEEVVFDDVLMISDEGDTHVGKPRLRGAAVTAEVIKHGLEDKVVVFKFKRRKGERRKAGHRQGYTEVRIKEIHLHHEEKAAPEQEPAEQPNESGGESTDE
jgi:large subunit ribosomal protein L21